MMILEPVQVRKVSEVAQNTFELEFHSPPIARLARPGQFINIKIDHSTYPLLRRPMSISDVEAETVSILFNVVGQGTSLLARTRPGEQIDVLGPLGHGFQLLHEFDRAVIVAGGLGVAPFPFLTRELLNVGVSVQTFVGARTARQLALDHLTNVSVATDDGSRGYHGTVIELLRSRIATMSGSDPMIYGCGPAGMLRALQSLVRDMKIPCQISLETSMACGIGICQGCPVETAEGKKYKLACKDGPVFDASTILV
jgi:dihydroorotate dehydrogenase electron transfer subunit